MKMKLTNIVWGVIMFFVTVVIINIGLYIAWSLTHPVPRTINADIFQMLAASIIITWILLVIAYYIWAIKFYCINYGWTDADWAAKSGKPLAPDFEGDISKATTVKTDTPEPDENPNKDQSMGLPEGTVRATIALSMIVTGLSMTIASFSLNNTFPLNALFIDHYEFFKTGFLMVIAFYFGTKSLDILRKTNIEATLEKRDGVSATKKPVDTGGEDEIATNPNSNGVTVTTANPFLDPTARG